MGTYNWTLCIMKTECPKCTSKNAWVETTKMDKILRCFCGLYKILETKMVEIIIEKNDVAENVKLPERGSNLWSTLMVLSVLEPSTTGDITTRLKLFGKEFDTSDISSYLTTLRSKGLVNQLEYKRGVAGGSTWGLTDKATELLGG